MFPFPFPGSASSPERLRARSIGAGWRVALLLLAAAPERAAADPAAAPPPLSVGVPGGAMAEAMRAAFFAPFTQQSGIVVRDVQWDGRLSTLESRARDGAGIAATLVLMNAASVLAGCREGLLLPLDRDAIAGTAPAAPAATKPGADGGSRAGGRCGLGAFRTGLVLAWDRSRMDSVPGWTEFWDVARRPGKRGLSRDPRGTLEIALLADGVAPADIYRTLNTADGLDRAFHKLDQLKPYLVWWTTPAEAVQLIESGAVLMTSAPDEAVAAADQAGHRDFGIQWQGSLSMLTSWAMPGRPVPAGAPDPAPAGAARDEATRLLGFTLQPDRQAAFLSRFPAAPAVATGIAGDGDQALRKHVAEALPQDDAFWAAHLPAIRARFDAWVGS